VHKTCAKRGGDGFAFVVRDQTGPLRNDTVGEVGAGLGYAGLTHTLAVEFDNWYNTRMAEPFDPHVAVHTRGAEPNSAHHAHRLGFTTDVPSFWRGRHTVKVAHTPNPNAATLLAALESGALRGVSGAVGASTAGLTGLLSVYIDDMSEPKLTVPLTMNTVLRPNSKTAYVGFTAATGSTFQVVEILAFNFSSAGRSY